MPDDPLVDRDAFADLDEDDRAPEVLEDSAKVLTELDRLDCCGLDIPFVEEATNVGEAVVALLDEVRPEVELELLFVCEEEACRYMSSSFCGLL
jgi:hypothetical protein